MKRLLLLPALGLLGGLGLTGCHEPAENVCWFTAPDEVGSWWRLSAGWEGDPNQGFGHPFYRCRAEYAGEFAGWCVFEDQRPDGSVNTWVEEPCWL